MPPQSRSSRRIRRYRELRALGFSAVEARRLRDRSGANISASISTEQRKISRKPVRLRTTQEIFRLERIRNYRTSGRVRIRQNQFLDSRRERWQKFSEWSKANAFPAEFRDRIFQINAQAGRPRFDGYGYRRFYFEYVEQLSMEDSLQFSDRGDSGVRYLMNKSLVRGRTNLRRLINPPTSKSGAA